MDYASRILVVEDEPGISGFIAAILTVIGYSINDTVIVFDTVVSVVL